MTREEAIDIIECGDISNRWGKDGEEVEKMAIKALKQESILDKIRVEIEKAVWEDVVSLDGETDELRIPRLDPDDVFEIIDKYKGNKEK